MIHNKIHLISPCCPRPSITLQVQNCGLKHQSFLSMKVNSLGKIIFCRNDENLTHCMANYYACGGQETELWMLVWQCWDLGAISLKFSSLFNTKYTNLGANLPTKSCSETAPKYHNGGHPCWCEKYSGTGQHREGQKQSSCKCCSVVMKYRMPEIVWSLSKIKFRMCLGCCQCMQISIVTVF